MVTKLNHIIQKANYITKSLGKSEVYLVKTIDTKDISRVSSDISIPTLSVSEHNRLMDEQINSSSTLDKVSVLKSVVERSKVDWRPLDSIRFPSRKVEAND